MTKTFSLRKPPSVSTDGTAKNLHRPHLFATFARDLLKLGGIATFCTCIGLTLNQMRDQPLPLIYVSKEARLRDAVAHLDANSSRASLPANEETSPIVVPNLATSPRIIDLEEFQQLVQSKSSVVLDARPEIFYRSGHVPGALNVPREEFEPAYVRRRAFFESMRGKAIAVYCSSTSCEDSQMVADALIKLGYRHILVFQGGWEAWTRAGLPEERR